jgi:hypothetical protein
MAILDRPMFQRPLTKDQLRGYGLPAFANGGVVRMNKGGDPSGLFAPKGKGFEIQQEKKKKPKIMLSDIFGDTNIEDRIEPETALTNVVDENYKDKILRDLQNSSPVLTEQEPSTETTESIESDATDSARRLEAEEKAEEKDLEQTGSGEMNMDDSRSAFERFKEKSDFYKDVLSKYGEDDMRTQGFLQLAQFGLNLMSQAGGNFLDKVAKSAQDPLKAFADIASRNTQAQKELDVLALKQVEDEIATEKQNKFQLELQAIKDSGGSDKVKVEKYADILIENFPEQYPNTKDGRAKAIEQGFKYVEESPEEPLKDTVMDFKKIILADPGQYGAIDPNSLEIDYDMVEQIAERLAKGKQIANQGGGDVITDPNKILSTLEQSAGT